MIGISLAQQRGVVAAFRDGQPAVVGTGRSLAELAGVARARFGDDCLARTSVIAVPAWFNDVRRQGIVDEARAAGLNQVRLLNRPTAVAIAYFALRPAVRTTVAVLDLEEDCFDVAVLSKTSLGFEVLGADGNPDLAPGIAADATRLAGEIGTAMSRALQHAGIRREQLDDVLCAGSSARLEGVVPAVATLLGRGCSSELRPEDVVALGAALNAALVEQTQPATRVAAPTEPGAPSPRGAGCLGMVAVIAALIFVLI